MSRWFEQLHFLWEEEIAPPEEVPRADREEPAGVPTPLRGATRFAVIGVVAVSLMAQVIGVHLVAPVAAAASYCSTCAKQCASQCGPKNPPCITNCKKMLCPGCL